MIEIREVRSPEGMKEIFPVARSAWGMEEPESFIADMLNALKYHGGLVLGAYDGGEMVGFQYAFIGRRGELFYLYSHMTGVLEERKHEGIGYELKTAQKKWAIENGFGLVAWTFDPLMGLNANFNLRKLGVIGRAYRPNFYGVMRDRLNRGVETDRLLAEWWVGVDRKAEDFDPFSLPVVNTTEQMKHGARRITGITFPDEEMLVVEIPYSFSEIKSLDIGLAVDWRRKTREVFTTLFARGFTAVSSASVRDRRFYLLRRNFTVTGIPPTSPFASDH